MPDEKTYKEYEATAKKAAQEMERNEAPGQGLKKNPATHNEPFNKHLKHKPSNHGITEKIFKGRAW